MAKNKFMPISLVIVFILLAAGIASGGLIVSNAILEKEVAPGDHINHVINAQTRASDPPMDFIVDIYGYGQSLDGGSIGLNASQDTSPYTARPFFNVSPQSFHLDPGKSQEVTLEGDIPKDAGSGGRYALVKIHSLPTGNGTVGFAVGAYIPIRLTISKSEVMDRGEIVNLSLEEPVLAAKQKASFIFKNTGNHHYGAKAEAILEDKEGKTAANASVHLGLPLIPGNSRLTEIDLIPKTPLKPGTYIMNTTVSTENGIALATKEVSFEIKS